MKPRKRSTYLSRVQSNYYSRKWYRREVRLVCNLLFTTKGIRKPQLHRCLITEISEGGALLQVGKLAVPDHLYLVLGKFDFFIGSVVIERNRGSLHLCFVKELAPLFVNRLSRLTSPFATLESMRSKTMSAPKPPQERLQLSGHAASQAAQFKDSKVLEHTQLP